MADIEKGLPVRTEDDAQQKIQSKIVDFTTPTQGAEVDTDKNLHVEVHGNNPAGGDEVMRMSDLGHPAIDGIYDATNNTDPSQMAVAAHVRATTPADTDQTIRVTAKNGSVATTVWALDVSLHDEDGNNFSDSNPLPVTEAFEGTEINDYNTATVASEATSNHDRSIANGVTVRIFRVSGASTARCKWELQIGDGAVSEAFTTQEVKFNSEDVQGMEMVFDKPITVTGTVNTTTIRLIRTNRDDDDSADVYSTMKLVQL